MNRLAPLSVAVFAFAKSRGLLLATGLLATALFVGCQDSGLADPQTEVEPQFAKPDCSVDPSHPSCDGGGEDPISNMIMLEIGLKTLDPMTLLPAADDGQYGNSDDPNLFEFSGRPNLDDSCDADADTLNCFMSELALQAGVAGLSFVAGNVTGFDQEVCELPRNGGPMGKMQPEDAYPLLDLLDDPLQARHHFGGEIDLSTTPATGTLRTRWYDEDLQVNSDANNYDYFLTSDDVSGAPNGPWTFTDGVITMYGTGFSGFTCQWSGTVSVTVTSPPAPTLSQVIISPESLTLLTGAAQQFTASGLLSDGSATSVTVDYTATGGTVTSGGLYTAGGTPGSFQVVATESGSGLADTAAVTVLSSSGFTEIYRLDSFAGQDPNQIFQARGGTSSVVGDWYRQTIRRGDDGGWADIQLDGMGGRPNEISSGTVRWSARVRLSVPWEWWVRLLFFAGTPPGDYDAAAGTAGQCPADGKGGDPNRQFFLLRSMFDPYEPGWPLRYFDQFVSQTGTVLGNCFGVTGMGGGFGTATYFGGDYLPVGGADLRIMHELRLNTPGSEDGYHRIYIDGALRAEFTDISYREAGSNVVLSTVGFKPFTSDQNRSGSDIYIEFSELLLEHDPTATPSPPGPAAR